MEFTTYYFGAGASTPIVPTVAELSSSIASLAQVIGHADFQLSTDKYFADATQYKSREACRLDLVEKLSNLSSICHPDVAASIDTVAYIHKLNSRINELNELKMVLSAFFHLHQSTGRFDTKYQLLLAHLISEEKQTIGDNYRIVSWNYDIQLEKAFNSIYTSKNIFEAQRNMRLSTVYNFSKSAVYDSPFKVYKLNGTSGFYNNKNNSRDIIPMTREFCNKLDSDYIESFLANFYTAIYKKEFISTLHFAWEDVLSNKLDYLNSIANDISRTDNLVVVGYSFPKYNRSVDELLISRMNPKRIIIQDLNPEPIIEALEDILNGKSYKVIPKKGPVNNFYIHS